MRRPTLGQAARSPTALWNLLASLLLGVSLVFPHRFLAARIRAVLAADRVPSTAAQETADHWHVLLLWPYAFAWGTFFFFAALVVFRPRGAARSLVWLPLLMACALGLVWFALLFSGSVGSRMAMWSAVLAAPFTGYVVIRSMALVQQGRPLAAAAWGQSLLCVLAMFTLRWLWFLPTAGFRWGSVISVLAAAAMMLASWTWEVRAEHDLANCAAPHPVFQVSIRQLVLAVAWIAIGLAYWRLLGAG